MDVSYQILALSFLQSLETVIPTTPNFYVISRIALETNLNVSAVGLWRAFIQHSWYPEKMAKHLLVETFGIKKTEEQVNKAVDIQAGHDQRALNLAHTVQFDMETLVRLTKCTMALLKDFLLPIKNPSYNKIGPKDLQQASRGGTFRQDIIQRDRYQCPVTDKFDRACFEYKLIPNPNPLPGQSAFGYPVRNLTYPCLLQAAHILPHSLAYHTAAHTFINWFTNGGISEFSIHGDMINSLRNGLTLQADAHKDFDDFLWGIEEVVVGGISTFRAVRIGADNCSVDCGLNGRDIVFRNTWPGEDGKLDIEMTPPSAMHLRLHLTVGRMLYDARAL